VSGATPSHARFGAARIQFSLTETPQMLVWSLPLHAAHIKRFRFVVNGANAIEGARLDRQGLHMTLGAQSIRPGVFSIEPPDWRDVWTRNNAAYEGIEALAVLLRLRADFVPPKRTRGQRGAARDPGAADAFMAHVIVENLETGAGMLQAAIHGVALTHPELLRHVWPDHHDNEPHRIRKHIQRALRSARRIP
jgi:hypothetical protein